MSYLAAAFLLIFPLSATAYAHLRLSRDTASRGVLWRTRTILILLALAFGSAMTWFYADTAPPVRILIFLSAAGLTHVPAAGILLLKHWQQSGR